MFELHGVACFEQKIIEIVPLARLALLLKEELTEPAPVLLAPARLNLYRLKVGELFDDESLCCYALERPQLWRVDSGQPEGCAQPQLEAQIDRQLERVGVYDLD